MKLIGDKLINEIKEKDSDYLLNKFINKIKNIRIFFKR